MNDDTPAVETPVPTKTTLSKGWVIKSGLIILVFLGLAAWGYLDATVIYINRGQNHVNHARKDYLVLMRDARRFSPEETSVVDPQSAMDRITVSGPGATDLDRATFEWLEAVDRIENLNAVKAENEAELEARANGEPASDTKTMFADPRAHLQELEAALASAKQPKPLSQWDLPIQWGFVVIGLGGGIPLFLLFLAHARKSYTYDPATRTVTLPDGTDVTPQNLTGFDKRKWDRFLLFITLEGESDERKIDLYRYNHLEGWLVDVYEHSTIYEPDEEDEDEQDPDESHDDHEDAGDDETDPA